MKRLVYNPHVDVYIKADTGIYDISPYVTNCTITRRTNQVSSASVTFRNPNFKWTNFKTKQPDGSMAEGPVFHPMDPIIITLTRLRDRPIQVFTGFCDTTPYLQLFPGTCTLEASCTLKRLEHVYWDPGLPFVWNYLISRGWQIDKALGGIAKLAQEAKNLSETKTLTDGSIGGLLNDILIDVAGWKPDTVFIEELPKDLVAIVEKLFMDIDNADTEARDEFFDLLHQMIGTSNDAGGGGGGGDGKGGPVKGHYSKEDLRKLAESVGVSSSNSNVAAAVAMAESGGDPKAVNVNSSGSRDRGLWQINDQYHSEVSDDCAFNPVCNAKAMYKISSGGTSWGQWATFNNGSYRSFL